MPKKSRKSSAKTSLFSGDMQLPTGEQVYDSIMCQIEPELLLSNLQNLDAPYLGESEQHRTERYERYGKAFAKYQGHYQAWIKSLKSAVNVYKKAVIKASEKVSASDDSAKLETLSSQILSA